MPTLLTKKSGEKEHFSRYSRQLVFGRFGIRGQRFLSASKVAIVGLGAIGSVASQLLARAGVGNLVLIDRDVVELSNLQRQFYGEADIGKPKAAAAAANLRAANSKILLRAEITDLEPRNVHVIKADLVLDCSDNVETRLLINDFCRKEKIAWVHAAALGAEGIVFPVLPSGPCLRCFYPQKIGAGTLETCETAGVLNVATTVAGALQAAEAIKILIAKEVRPRLMRFDVLEGSIERFAVTKNESCQACNGRFPALEKGSSVVRTCGDVYQIRPEKSHVDIKDLARRLRKIGEVRSNKWLLSFTSKEYEATIFADGRAAIRGAENERRARAIYARIVG